MRRHSIIARLGPTDTVKVSLKEPQSVVTEFRLVDGERRLGFGLGQMMDQLTCRSLTPRDEAVDLCILAAAVTAADTRITRASESQDSWTREIDLYAPVQRPDLWTSARLLIERMLNFLTGDRWRVYFRGRPKDNRILVEHSKALTRPSFDSVCLFSGGLDSFTGAIDLLEVGEKLLFVSHYWDNSTRSQIICAKRLGKQYGDITPRHVRARVGFPNDLVKGCSHEQTLRGRSFLFFSLAALAASSLNKQCVIHVPENGLISLNVPLDPMRLGAWSTRTTHPFYMARWTDLLRHLGLAMTLENGYRFKTKGEILHESRNRTFLEKNIEDTVSCSSYTKGRYKGLSQGHCGYCVPCLIRRASIEMAFGNDPTPYVIVPDLTAHTLASNKAEGENVRSFQMMVDRLAKQPALASILVHKSGPLSDYPEAEIDQYADVFRRGIAEIGNMIRDVKVKPS